MSIQHSKNTLDSAVPQPAKKSQLREGEKKSLELGELAEHEQGEKKEKLQRQAQSSAEKED